MINFNNHDNNIPELATLVEAIRSPLVDLIIRPVGGDPAGPTVILQVRGATGVEVAMAVMIEESDAVPGVYEWEQWAPRDLSMLKERGPRSVFIYTDGLPRKERDNLWHLTVEPAMVNLWESLKRSIPQALAFRNEA